jgi:hypothetical protein
MAPFVEILIGSDPIAGFGDETIALVMYDTETLPVKSAPAAECVTVIDDKILQPVRVRSGTVRSGSTAPPTEAIGVPEPELES